MNVETALEANAQFAEIGKPGQSLLTFHTALRSACVDPPFFQILLAAGKVLTFVHMQFDRPLAKLAGQARHYRYHINRAGRCGLNSSLR